MPLDSIATNKIPFVLKGVDNHFRINYHLFSEEKEKQVFKRRKRILLEYMITMYFNKI
jgi:hypothetical protein